MRRGCRLCILSRGNQLIISARGGTGQNVEQIKFFNDAVILILLIGSMSLRLVMLPLMFFISSMLLMLMLKLFLIF